MAKDQAPGALAALRGGKQSGQGKPPAQAGDGQAAAKKRANPFVFLREVRAEARKITWTSRKETWITSVMVFIMVALATTFFWIVDLLLGLGVSQVIRLGG